MPRLPEYPLLRLALLVLLCAAGGAPLAAQPRMLRIACFDADRLYDTVPALFYDDSDFTPDGRMHWTAGRYGRKIRDAAALLDSLASDIAAVTGVENEGVVRDLAAACHEEYCFLHRTLNRFDGLDIALLYRGDRFRPLGAREGRGWLFVVGEVFVPGAPPRRVGVLVALDARHAAEALADRREEHPALPLLVAGRFAPELARRFGLHDAHARAERAGRGNVRYRSGWRMRDRILVDTLFAPPRVGDVYARRRLVSPHDGAPVPTYDRTTYRGGVSRALPVYAEVELR